MIISMLEPWKIYFYR